MVALFVSVLSFITQINRNYIKNNYTYIQQKEFIRNQKEFTRVVKWVSDVKFGLT